MIARDVPWRMAEVTVFRPDKSTEHVLDAGRSETVLPALRTRSEADASPYPVRDPGPLPSDQDDEDRHEDEDEDDFED